MKTFLILIILTCFSTFGFSQMLWGKVYNLDDVMIDSACINLGYEKTFTDASGQFTTMINPESLKITITAKGYKPIEQEVNAEKGFDYMLRVLLVPESSDKKTFSSCFVTVKKQ